MRAFRIAALIAVVAFAALAVNSAAVPTTVTSFKTVPLNGIADIQYSGGGVGYAKVMGQLNLNVKAILGTNQPTAQIVVAPWLQQVIGHGQAIAAAQAYGKMYKVLGTDYFSVCTGTNGGGGGGGGASISGIDGCQVDGGINGTYVKAQLEFDMWGLNTVGQQKYATLYVCLHMNFNSAGKLISVNAQLDDCGYQQLP